MFLEIPLFFGFILWVLWRIKRRLFQKSVKGEIVLITGGASGIGLLTAQKMAKEGAQVAVWDINQEAMNQMKEAFTKEGKSLYTAKVDVTSRVAIEAAADQLLKELGRVDILINNAGIVSGKEFLKVAPESAQRTMDVNILSQFWTVRSFLPGMTQRNHGHIVTIASMAGHVAVPKLADYAASKFAAVGFDESLRVEMKKLGLKIHTTCVCPFYINTGMFTGVQTRIPLLMPILEPDYVASKIVSAIKMNDEMLMMPWAMNLVPWVRLFPVPIQDFLFDAMGSHSSMDHFVGRQAPVPQKKTE